jgi:hypothetical protein
VEHSLQRRFRGLVTAALLGLAVWKYAPLIPGYVELDRAVFAIATRTFANPPFFISGTGSQDKPWTLRTLSAVTPASTRTTEIPVIAIDDDREGVFQSSPPSAVDYAVILRNLKRLGVRHVALSALMAWDAADPIALTAVDSRLAEFDSAVTAAPLTRSAVADPLPLPFYRASLSVKQVIGDVSALPQVNRPALPGTFLGSGKTLAGFSMLESEPATDAPPMLARWKDRIIFAFPIVAALAESGQPTDQIEVRLGSSIKLGPSGPVVPIDAAGRLTSDPRHPAGQVIPARSLIAATALESSGSVLIRDDREEADAETKHFSATVAALQASIMQEASLSPARAFERLPTSWELGLILGLALLTSRLRVKSASRLRFTFALIAALLLIAQLTAVAWCAIWLPLYPSLSALAISFLAARPLRSPPITQQDLAEPILIPEPPAEPPVIASPIIASPIIASPIIEPPIIEPPIIESPIIEPPIIEPPITKTRAPRKSAAGPAKKSAKKIAPTKSDPIAKKVAKKATPAKKAAKKTAAKAPKSPTHESEHPQLNLPITPYEPPAPDR